MAKSFIMYSCVHKFPVKDNFVIKQYIKGTK